jgi:beta-galactosidase
VKYQLFTEPKGVKIGPDLFGLAEKDLEARWWMEFLTPTTAKLIARFEHHSWPNYAAITRNTYGKGEVTYIGFMPSDALIEGVLTDTAKRAGVAWPDAARFPLIVRSGTLTNGSRVRYLLNYSPEKQNIPRELANGTDLLTGRQAASTIEPWGVAIVESSR